MKKYLQFFMIAILASVTHGLASCSDDKDEPKDGSLAGTSWVINTCTDDSDGESDDDVIGLTITFQKDGNIKFTPATDWTYAKWTQNGNTLRLTVGEGEPDDFMEGTYTINGKNATYKYSWYDCDGNWGGSEHYTMTLTKK